jgi:putative DNA primase/helicase
MAEASGILAWAVRGCLLWQQRGLVPPPAVLAATAAYHAESDHLPEFIETKCIVNPDGRVQSSRLYQAYCAWAQENGEIPLSRIIFAARMRRKGFRPGRSGHAGTRTWEGIRLYADTLTG